MHFPRKTIGFFFRCKKQNIFLLNLSTLKSLRYQFGKMDWRFFANFTFLFKRQTKICRTQAKKNSEISEIKAYNLLLPRCAVLWAQRYFVKTNRL